MKQDPDEVEACVQRWKATYVCSQLTRFLGFAGIQREVLQGVFEGIHLQVLSDSAGDAQQRKNV